MFSKMTLIAATAALLTAAPLSGQVTQGHHGRQGGQQPGGMMMQGAGGMMMQGGMMGGMQHQMMSMMSDQMGMMMAMGPGPAMLSGMKDALELSDDQVARLKELSEKAGAARMEQMEKVREARMAARQALSGPEPDFDALETHLSEAAAQMVQAHVAMARAAAEAREVLTDEQRSKLHTLMSMMRGVMMGSDTMWGSTRP